MYLTNIYLLFPPQPHKPFTNPEIPSLLAGSLTGCCFLNAGSFTKFRATSKNNGLHCISSISGGIFMTFGSLPNTLESS